MIDEKVVDWFCLINSKGVGPKAFWKMLKRFKTVPNAFNQLSQHYPRKEAENALKSMKYNVILASDSRFPKLLKRSSSCPPMLYYKGKPNSV